VNKHVLGEALGGHSVGLWFVPTADSTSIEAKLIGELQPPWNRQGIS